jgi:hypothetical protein
MLMQRSPHMSHVEWLASAKKAVVAPTAFQGEPFCQAASCLLYYATTHPKTLEESHAHLSFSGGTASDTSRARKQPLYRKLRSMPAFSLRPELNGWPT